MDNNSFVCVCVIKIFGMKGHVKNIGNLYNKYNSMQWPHFMQALMRIQ